MKTSIHGIEAWSVVGAALLCLIEQLPLFAQLYEIRPTCSPKGQCKANTAWFGYNDTNWRQWPLQPRPEEKNPKTVGTHVLPTPPPILQQPLPHAEGLPAKPPLSGGESVLPALPELRPGATPGPDGNKGGPAVRPNGPGPEKPAGQNPPEALPGGLPGLVPEGLDRPGQPDTKPKAGGSGFEPLTPPKAVLPGGLAPDTLMPTPGTPAAEPPATPGKDLPAPKSPVLPPDQAPTPAFKPDEPSPGTPKKGSSLLRRGTDNIAARATAIKPDLPMQANWNASLEPEFPGDNNLRSTSFEQGLPDNGNPLRSALGGYCPVQLHEHDRWSAGSADFQTSYQGQVYHFSSAAAQKRFEAAPEKYVPVQNGNDVVLTAEENRTVPGSVDHSAVWHGRLYLFSSSATLAMFREDPARYADNQRQPTDLQPLPDSL